MVFKAFSGLFFHDCARDEADYQCESEKNADSFIGLKQEMIYR